MTDPSSSLDEVLDDLDRALDPAGYARRQARARESVPQQRPDELRGLAALDLDLAAAFEGKHAEASDYVDVPGETLHKVRVGSPAHQRVVEEQKRRATARADVAESRSPQSRTVEIREVIGWEPR